jgi:uncharacterized protein YbjT (DUF2867 family)
MTTVLVTGATGTIGRPLVETLAFRGVRVRAAARSIMSRDFPARVSYFNADLAEPQALAPALKGVDTLFVHPRAVGENAAKLVTLAAEHGVRRVVALSAIDVDDDPALQPSRFNGDRNREVEEAVVNSGLSWVSVRAASYATHVLGMFAAQIRAGDVVRGPYATFAESLLHEKDLVDVIARALQDGDLDQRQIEATGPQSLTHEEMVDIIAEVIGRPLRFEEIPPEMAARELVANGLPAEFATALMARCERGAGQPATVTDEVQQITGHPARTFAQWVANHAAMFRSTL